MRLSINKEDR